MLTTHVNMRWQTLAMLLALAALDCGTNQTVAHHDDWGSGGSSDSSGSSSEVGVCPGQCVEIVPLSEAVVLSLLWFGPVEQEPPPCPSLAPVAVDEGMPT